MALTAASTILHTVPLNPVSEEFLTRFWSLRTVTSAASSVAVHLALACRFGLLFGGVVGLGEARRVEGQHWEFSGCVLTSECEERLEAACVTICPMCERA